jgi:hypothetical protein
MEMSYDRIGNCRIRENGRKINIFDKVNEIKQHLKDIIPEIESDKLIVILSHCRAYYEGKLHYGRRNVPENLQRTRELTTNERIVYEYLLKSKLNPSTTYRWFIATRLPQDIREKLAKGQIGQKKAMEISANRRNVKLSNMGLLMTEEIRKTIQKLEWEG